MNAQQLRNSILQEAIEGRLVPQDPNDEPASLLLDKIRAEKKQLVKESKLKKKDLEETPISENEKPFEIPDSWEWVRLNEVIDVRDGTHDTPTYILHGYPLITGKDFYNGYFDLSKTQYISESDYIEISKRSRVDIGDILFSMIGGNIGSQILITMDNYFEMAIKNVALFKQYPSNSVDPKYLYFFLEARVGHIKSVALGGAQSFVPLKMLRTYLFPLPPLAEQKRIVAKIEVLLSKVEEYGKAQEALNKLNEELPEKLKKSVLQEAITGKLVPQDPNDEPASVLLERIREEKKRLVKEGKLKKKDLEETPINEDEIPFDIPDSWKWVRLGEITCNHGQKKPSEAFSYIDIGSIDNKKHKLNQVENIVEAKDAPSRARKIVKSGDIIYSTVRPYLHNICVIDRDFVKEPIASTGFAVLSCISGVYNHFLFFYLLSPIFDSYANDGDNAKGIAYPAINDQKLYNGIVPLPPLAEQKRIVAKIEEVFKEIDKLKTSC